MESFIWFPKVTHEPRESTLTGKPDFPSRLYSMLFRELRGIFGEATKVQIWVWIVMFDLAETIKKYGWSLRVVFGV